MAGLDQGSDGWEKSAVRICNVTKRVNHPNPTTDQEVLVKRCCIKGAAGPDDLRPGIDNCRESSPPRANELQQGTFSTGFTENALPPCAFHSIWLVHLFGALNRLGTCHAHVQGNLPVPLFKREHSPPNRW
ncbi:hypothetical protein CEXT_145192 [Caerostris extrusa]|uniref:Uncharacterized protein n=1 Tax=Caerostris extrusa TaxID=172846 RepID=A0AAV4PX20_CAEEX|nr:hypothetical protein CEXT_145192 [Caerostris extrusa]